MDYLESSHWFEGRTADSISKTPNGLIKEAQGFAESGNPFMAAENYAQAASILVSRSQAGDVPRAVDLRVRAAELYGGLDRRMDAWRQHLQIVHDTDIQTPEIRDNPDVQAQRLSSRDALLDTYYLALRNPKGNFNAPLFTDQDVREMTEVCRELGLIEDDDSFVGDHDGQVGI